MSAVPNFQPFEVSDFSGGRTDNYISGAKNRYKIADNLLVVKHGLLGKLLQRDGSIIYNNTYPLVNSAIERLGVIRNFRTDSTGDKVLVQSNRDLFYLATGWTALLGPTSNKLFPTGTTTANVSIFAEWQNHIYWTNDAFAPVSKVYPDGSGNLKLRTAGLPRLASNPTITPGANTGKTFIYRFVYKYTYTVGTVTFIDRGGYVEVEVTNADAPNVNANAITAIPVLANGTTYNWETTAIKVEVYRTINEGTTFYYVSEVTIGTTTYSDSTSDTTLQTHERLYTEGGVVENGPVPLAKYIHIAGDIGYFAHLKDGSQILSGRVIQSIPGDPDSVGEDFFVDVPEEITGLSSVKGRPIILTRTGSVYRIDGQFDLQGRGGMVAERINDSAPCVSAQSAVQTIEGVFWAGPDSYYFTDGLQVIKLCEDWTASYQLATLTTAQQKRIQGKYDGRNRRIWWTIQSDSGGSSDVDSCDVLHLDWGIRRDACFTSASGGDEFAPTAIEFVGGEMLRGDKNGYLLIHESGRATDPKIEVAVIPADWEIKTIIYRYESCAYNFGSDFMRKYVTKLTVSCKNRSNLSLQVISINDDGRKQENLKPIRFRGNCVWGDETAGWGIASIVWNYDGLIEDERNFPARSLRCSYKQIVLTNAYVPIINSDLLGTVSVNSSTKVVTLTNEVSLDWPVNIVDYFVSFSNDGYSRDYQITARTADTITYLDSGNFSVGGAGLNFVLRGYPKKEIINILGYTINYVFMGQTQQFFTGAQSGEVGSS